MTAHSQRLAEFVAGLGYHDIPTDVIERIKLLTADLVGIAIRARHDADSTPTLMGAAADLGLGDGECGVFGGTETFGPLAAAFLNGALGHSLDFDDTHARASTHPGAPVIPAALAAAEMTGADGKTLLAGIVAGYETHVRLSLGVVPKEHYAKGHALTSTCGALAAAAAAARVFRLSPDQVEQAFGAALSQCAGTLQFLQGGGWGKRFQVGYASLNGLFAATLARNGYQGPEQPIEGRHGFLNTFSGAPQPDNVSQGLGSVFETLNVAVKPYPSCRYCHAGTDGVIELARRHDIAPGDVESVTIGTSHTGWTIIGDPLAEKHRPGNVTAGQFSMPFCAAVALIEGGMGWDDYDRHLNNPDTLALAARIDVVEDARAEQCFPAQMSASVRIVAGGETYETFVEIPKGEPENFVTPGELNAKFTDLAGPYLPPEKAAALFAALMQIDDFAAPRDAFAHAFADAPAPPRVAAG